MLHALDAQQLKVPARRFDPADAAAPSSVRYETERWLSLLARPTEIKTEAMVGTGAYSLQFRIPGEEWVRSTNMGFGVTYSLPVVLAGLLAAEGGTLIVENPEAHLHPAGQSSMGGFLARVAATGTQVVVETHSDHVLNGIRLAVARDKVIQPEEVLVHYFDAKSPGASKLTMNGLGALSSWPPGFFDQFQVDVASLTRVRRAP